MKLTRTRDMALVTSICADPKIFPHTHEDGHAAPAPTDHDDFHWMLVDDGAPAGVFLVHAMNAHCLQMHTALLPRIWGCGAARAAQLLLEWAFTQTDCRKMVTTIPAYNKAALRFAIAGGMTREGVNRASYLKNGVMIDQIMLGITKKEWEKCLLR